MLTLMVGFAAIAAAGRSASSLHQTVLLSGGIDTCSPLQIMPPPPPPSPATATTEEEHVLEISSTTPPPSGDNPAAPLLADCPNQVSQESSHLLSMAALHVLVSNTMMLRRKHQDEKHRLQLQAQHRTHRAEMAILRRDMDHELLDLRVQLNDLRNGLDQLQHEEQQRPSPTPSYWEVTSSTARAHLQTMLAGGSSSNLNLLDIPIQAPIVLLLLLLSIVPLMILLRRRSSSRRSRPNNKEENAIAINNCHHHQQYLPLPPPSSPSCSIPSMMSSADSCSSPSSLGAATDGSGSSSATSPPRCPPYIAIPSVQHRRMTTTTTATTIEQMARDADAQHPHGSLLLHLPPPPLLPPLDLTQNSHMNKTKPNHVLRRKARILSRKAKATIKKAKKSPVVRCCLLAAASFLATFLATTAKASGFGALNGLFHPIGLVMELLVTFAVFLFAGYRLASLGTPGTNKSTAANTTAARSPTKRRKQFHRSLLIRGPATVRRSSFRMRKCLSAKSLLHVQQTPKSNYQTP